MFCSVGRKAPRLAPVGRTLCHCRCYRGAWLRQIRRRTFYFRAFVAPRPPAFLLCPPPPKQSPQERDGGLRRRPFAAVACLGVYLPYSVYNLAEILH